MTKARRQERREQRKARRHVRRETRRDNRGDRRDARAEHRDNRADRVRARGNERRADRIERRADRSRGRANNAHRRADRSRERAEEIIGGNASTHRLEARLLSRDEWARFKGALQQLKADPNYWDDLVADHHEAMTFAHNNSDEYRYGFLTWHRQYLLDFEEDLQEVEPNICLPYWDWRSKRKVPKHMQVRDWMDLEQGRGKRAAAAGRKIKLNKIEKIRDFREMSDEIELLHNSIHGTLGGDMANPMTSPTDPIFFMHHAFVDKMWDYWQTHNPDISMDHPFADDILPGYPDLTNDDLMDSDELGVQYF
ncbi:MAG: tyrosinase family protein [Hellea sp.]